MAMKFNSYEEYEMWAGNFDDCDEYEDTPVVIDDGWKISADFMTDCKSWKVALRRFAKAFEEYDVIKDWAKGIRESVECGYWKDTCRPGWNATEDEEKVFYSYGNYSWGVEEVNDGRWYIYLNISGNYANREKKVA